MIVPDMFEQHRARHHPPFVAREIGEDAKFARGEVDRLAAAPHRLTEQIDLEIADAQPGLRDYRGAAPAQHVATRDRKSVVSGKSVSVRVDLGGCRIMTKKTHKVTQPNITTY